MVEMKARGKPRQLSFADRRRKDGRKRRRTGPKPSEKAGVPHAARPLHHRWNPVHVTLRAIAGLASFRTQVTFAAFERAVRGTRREDFSITEFSIQHDHVHMVVEADDNGALARGMKSFAVRANRLFNAATGRGRGRVWAGRYHRSDLKTPRQVRNALVYCLNNARKHGVLKAKRHIDPCSSARWFQGWAVPRSAVEKLPPATVPARTALLRSLWRKHGLLHPDEAPAAMGTKARRPSGSSVWQ